jgi:hypothetical protein
VGPAGILPAERIADDLKQATTTARHSGSPRQIRPVADKMRLLRFPRDVRLISFTIPAGADAAE